MSAQLYKQRVSFLIAMFSFVVNFAQNINLENYQWQNRVIVIISEDDHSEVYQKQLKEFQKDFKGFLERKLIIFDVQKERFRKITYNSSNPKIGNWEASIEMFYQFSDKKHPLKLF